MTSDMNVSAYFSERLGTGTPDVSNSVENDGLHNLVADLLLKNQLLRERVNEQDKTLMHITRIVTPRTGTDCNCHAEELVALIDRLLRSGT